MKLARSIPYLVAAIGVIALCAAAACLHRAWTVTRIDRAIVDRSIATMKPLPADPRARYAAAWTLERSQRYDDAARILAEVRASRDPALATKAWFALGNVHFERAIRSSREGSVAGSIAGSAEFDLARDAYRAALRIDPSSHGARYNLELLERLSPRPSGEGWRRNTDPIKIPPDRRAGWTSIKQKPKRGLP